MATCRFICDSALRKLGRLGAGREPRLADATDALNGLKSLYRTLITGGAFGRLQDVVPTADYTARENERVFRQASATLSITLPELVPNWFCGWGPYQYGDMWVPPVQNSTNRNMRPPKDGAIIVIADAFTGSMADFIYDGTIRRWLAVNGSINDLTGEVEPMTLDSEAPMSTRDPDGLAALLATKIADIFGADLAPTTISAAQGHTTGLTHNYSFPREVVAEVYY